jgi:hypothetical protein
MQLTLAASAEAKLLQQLLMLGIRTAFILGTQFDLPPDGFVLQPGPVARCAGWFAAASAAAARRDGDGGACERSCGLLLTSSLTSMSLNVFRTISRPPIQRWALLML